MTIIDAHAHIYPAPIAEKATQSIGDFYGLTMNEVGSVPRLLASGRAAGVHRYLVHSVAVSPRRVAKINDFVAGEVTAHPELTGFMTLHPEMTEQEIQDEVERAIRRGLKGIKLHPDIQAFDADGEGAERIYRAADGRLPILLHAGDDRYDFSAPERIARVAKRHPGTVFIAAHFGGYRRWDALDCYLGLDNVFFDTSSSLFLLPPERAAELILRHGPERFFFGTDFPIVSHAQELAYFCRLPLSESQREAILGENLLKALPQLFTV